MELKAGYKQTEIGVIPDDWDVTTVGAEFHIQLGKMLDTEKNVGVPKPFLGNRSVQWGYFDLADIGQIRLTPADIQRFRLRNGDLLVCEGGEVGRAAIWNQAVDECYFQKALHRLRPKGGYNVALMVSLLQRLANTGALQNYVTQTSIAHLPKDKFETVPIPSIPLVEQKAIADALSDADALIESLDQLIAKKRQIKQGAMQELLTCKRRLPGFSGEWSTKSLGDLGEFLKGSGVRKDETLSGDCPCIRYGEIYTKHSDWIREFQSWISTAVAATATRINYGDVLFAASGETKEEIGKCVAYVGQREAYAGGDIVILRTKIANPLFLGYYLNTEPVRQQKSSRGQGDAVVHIGANSLAAIKVALPSMEEQQAIATILSDMDTELAALESRLAKARQIKQGMMQELLTGRIRLL